MDGLVPIGVTLLWRETDLRRVLAKLHVRSQKIASLSVTQDKINAWTKLRPLRHAFVNDWTPRLTSNLV